MFIKKPLIYLASPYSAYSKGREFAFRIVRDKAAQLMEDGHLIFCPIVHSHIMERSMSKLQDGDFWLEQDFAVLERCDELWVYMMDGWKESYGVQREIAFALERRIPVFYCAPSSRTYTEQMGT